MDNVTLFAPGASALPSFIGLGSWLLADPGPDYGTKDLIHSLESANAMTDGGRFSYRYAPPRQMSLPLLVNPLYGVNRLANPGFETGDFTAWSLGGPGNGGTAMVVPNASGAVGSYFALATGIGSGGQAYIQQDLPLSLVPSGESMLIAARFIDFTPSSDGLAGAALQVLALGPSAIWIWPDQAAPGYQFGFDGKGDFSTLGVPSQWTAIGGICSAEAIASAVGYANATGFGVNAFFAYHPSAPPAGRSVGIDQMEFRSAYQQRAVREWESQLREYAMPGAFISVQPEGVPTSEAVFFDVIDGRYEPEYNIYENRAGVRKGTLYLTTQPWGYWPTQILLASQAANATAPLSLTWDPGTIVGDAPGDALVRIRSLIATQGVLASAYNYRLDALWWSMARASGATVMLSPSVFTAATPYNNVSGASQVLAAGFSSDAYSPVGAELQVRVTPSIGRWFPFAEWSPNPSVDALYRGRFRVFAYLRTTPSYALPVQITSDARNGALTLAALASSNQVATLLPQMATSYADLNSGNAANASGLFQILDLGEHVWPPAASGFTAASGYNWAFRLWANFGATSPGVASPAIELGGVYLLPLGNAGLFPRGLVAPTLNNVVATVGAAVYGGYAEIQNVKLDTAQRSILGLHAYDASGLDHYINVVEDLLANYRGILPQVTPSTGTLDAGFGGRLEGVAGATNATFHGQGYYMGGSVSYRPRFQFLHGL